jgi:tetratricopeptide (TPR) repeat protein
VVRRLGVFVGGISVDTARAVVGVGSSEPDLLASLADLADHNLLHRDGVTDGEPRFRMLETIRAYARERLAEAGELGVVQYQHAVFWRDLTEAASTELRRAGQVAWLHRLDREWPNIRAALTWCERADQIELGLRLAAALGWYWFLRAGHRWEGKTWLDHFCSRSASSRSAAAVRARALSAAGILAQYQLDLSEALRLQESALDLGRELGDAGIEAMAFGWLAHLCLFRTDFRRGDELAEQSYERCGELNDRWGMAFALGTRGLIARSEGRSDVATRYLRDSLNLFRAAGDRWGIAHVMLGLGQVALYEGDDRGAEECWQERLHRSRELDNPAGVAHTLDLLATVARQRGDYQRASSRFEEALTIKRKIGDAQASAWTLQRMGELALMRGETGIAYAHLHESLVRRTETGDWPGMVALLVAFARLAAVLGRSRRAVRLAGAADALYHAIGPALAVQHYSQGVLSNAVAITHLELERAQRRLGQAQRAAAWQEGQAMSREEAIAEALGLATELPVQPEMRISPHRDSSSGLPHPRDLTGREREVAALLARGYTNRQIADALVITEGSAKVQVVRTPEQARDAYARRGRGLGCNPWPLIVTVWQSSVCHRVPMLAARRTEPMTTTTTAIASHH